MKKVYLGLFCLLFVILSIFEVKNMIDYYNLQSYIHGSPIEFESVLEASVQSLCFENNGIDNQFIISSSSDIDLTGYDIADLEIQINNMPVNTSVETSNMISAEFTIDFYNADKEIVYTDTLYVSVSISETSTAVILKTVNGETAVSYWQSYIEKHGIFVKVIERERKITLIPQDIEYLYFNANTNLQKIKIKNNTINLNVVADVSSIGGIGTSYSNLPDVQAPAKIYINNEFFMDTLIYPHTNFNMNNRRYYIDDYAIVYDNNKYVTNLLNASDVKATFFAINPLNNYGQLKLAGVSKTLKVNVTFELENSDVPLN